MYTAIYIYIYIFASCFFVMFPLLQWWFPRSAKPGEEGDPGERVSACGGGKIHGTSTIFYLVNSDG